MFRSKLTLLEYQKSLQDETPAHGACDDDVEDIALDRDNIGTARDYNDQHLFDFDYGLMQIPNDFNDDEEVLVIDSQGNARKLTGRINVKVVQGLDPFCRILVPTNKLFQPVKKAGSIFNRFLADLAKRPRMCPLNYKEWRLVPQVFKDNIIEYINSKFLLPRNELVVSKVLSSVGLKLRDYRRTLRKKYVTAGSTKEELSKLPAPEETNGQGLTRPRGVGQTEWCGFINICFSDKFKERKVGRELGAIEWFVKTREKKGDNTFLLVETTDLVEAAKNIIKKKTGSLEVIFSESTKKVEDYAYRKLLGVQTKGKVSGLGSGVNASDIRNVHLRGQPPLAMKVLTEMRDMKQFFIHGAQASGTGRASSVDSHQGSMHNSPYEENRDNYLHNQDDYNEHLPQFDTDMPRSNVLGKEKLQGGEPKQVGNQMSSHKPPQSKVIPSFVKGGQSKQQANIQINPDLVKDGGQSKHPANIQNNPGSVKDGDRSKQAANIQSQLKPSNVQMIPNQVKDGSGGFNPSCHINKRLNDGKPKPQDNTLKLNNGDVQSHAGTKRKEVQPNGDNFVHKKVQKRPIKSELPRAAVEACVDKVLQGHPKEVNQYRVSSQRQLVLYYLAGMVMVMCNHMVEPNMLHAVLKEKLSAAASASKNINLQENAEAN